MHLRVLAVGSRQPVWVRDASRTYSERLPANWRFRLIEIDPGRGAQADPARQAERITALVRANEMLIALDEHGERLTSLDFARQLQAWLARGRDVAFIVGGSDGLEASLLQRADQRISLSKLTLAHGLARVVLLEQLYRATTLHRGHPYHRG